MSANVSAVLESRGDALTIPAEAVFVDGAQPFVFVVGADSTVHRTPLTLGTRLSDVVEVVDGIEPGSMVVRAGHQKLYEGAHVFPIQSQSETPPESQPEPGPGGEQL
jgi:multidrug efflux pump subunit AcrA (membrane-fusion protein)